MHDKQFFIGEKMVGSDQECYIIAEIGQAHDGSLGTAHAYIDAVSETGVDAIKFQTHIANAESTRYEQFRVSMFPQDRSRYHYWKRMEFTGIQWKELAEHSRDVGLTFLSSPFSIESAKMLDEIGVPAWKIGSGEISNENLIEFIAATGKPILLSTGMSSWKEVDEAVAIIESYDSPFSVFQCTTSYPCSAKNLGLNNLDLIRQRYNCPVGFSDHSGTIFAGLASANMGANLIEVHAVFSKKCFGPDVSSSVTIDELRQLVNGAKFISEAVKNPVEKDVMANSLSDVKMLFSRSIVVNKDLPVGYALTADDLSFKKPGIGISQKRANDFIGKIITKNYRKDDLLEEKYIKQ